MRRAFARHEGRGVAAPIAAAQMLPGLGASVSPVSPVASGIRSV